MMKVRFCDTFFNSYVGKWLCSNFVPFTCIVICFTSLPGMFVTDIANECRIVVENTDIQYSEMAALSKNSVQESFAEDSVKKSLMESLKTELEAFEGKWVAGAN